MGLLLQKAIREPRPAMSTLVLILNMDLDTYKSLWKTYIVD